MLSLGLDIGYSSVKLAVIDRNSKVLHHCYALHRGKINETLRTIINHLPTCVDVTEIRRGAVTGSGGKFLCRKDDITFANEATAIVEGAIRENSACESIVEIGGQSAKYITGFSAANPSGIKISMNSNCAAGTGSFLEEQISRLELKLEDYALYAGRAKTIPRIAGRCSVFAKTDIIHYQQEGVPVEDILWGLACAMVRNYRGAVMRKLPLRKPILFAGGVAHNQAIINAFSQVLHLREDEFIVPEHFAVIGALGAALIANKENCLLNVDRLLVALEQAHDLVDEDPSNTSLPDLSGFGSDDASGKHDLRLITPGLNGLKCWLGIDVGSTSTNLVLTDPDDRVVSFQYLRTMGKPLAVVREGLRTIKKEFGNSIRIVGVGVTGSGRLMIGKMVGADITKDEITSQARAGVQMDPTVDTIFEIGGQDSKYIALKDGIVRDFQMNKICAAGTGSFIEEQAIKFGIPIQDFGETALSSTHPISLGERCTVFMETSIAAHLARGARPEDIASGLCYSIVQNYLNRVVGQKAIGEKIFLQGGIAYNQGVVNAFRVLTGKAVQVPPFFSVTGAYGVAMLVREEMADAQTRFKGFDIQLDTRHENVRERREGLHNSERFSQSIADLVFEGYDGTLDPERKTVGIPRALFTYGMFPMFNAFFKELGLNVLLSQPTSEETIRAGQEYSLDETCYPVKLINGHVAELVQKKVDYIFFPDLFTVEHPGSHTRQNYGCAYMQLAFKMVNQAMELNTRGIELLAPTIAFSLGREFMMKGFSNLGKQMGKTPEQTGMALQKGMMAFQAYEKRIEAYRKAVIQEIGPDEKVFVIVSKIYGVADRVLNLGVPDRLMDMGYRVVPFFALPEGDISKTHPNMYWPFGQHILQAAQLVKAHPNLYAVLLTHHGCGPDSVMSHYVKEILEEKPYLHVEVDEHASHVGVITRVEAFVNSLNRRKVEKAGTVDHYLKKTISKKAKIETDLTHLTTYESVLLPYVFPYSEIVEVWLIRNGVEARVLPPTDQAAIDLGRRHTLTNEYFSLIALLGDVLNALQGAVPGRKSALLIPQTEGAEVQGQYSRFLRTKLDQEGYAGASIIAPLVEDIIYESSEVLNPLFLGLLAGDVIRSAHWAHRSRYLTELVDLMKNRPLEIRHVERMAAEIRVEITSMGRKKRILAVGEPLVLYNDFLNNLSFRNLEKDCHRVLYSPLSESMWLLWRDFIDQNPGKDHRSAAQALKILEDHMHRISDILKDESPFEDDLNRLVALAGHAVGYYAGANGRYREGKMRCDLPNIDGIINVMPMYENTGIALVVLHQSFGNGKPVLNLTFDGNQNENDRTKIDAFLRYL